MKKLTNLSYIMLLFTAVLLTNCKGDKGDTGPAGTAGTNGTNGTKGNANVIQVLFSDVKIKSVSIPAKTNYVGDTTLLVLPSTVTKAKLDSSLVLIFALNQYTDPETNVTISTWYSLPGNYYESNATYYFNANTVYTSATAQVGVALALNTSFTQDYFEVDYNIPKVKVIIAPAGSITSGRVNLTQYESVKEYFHLKD